MHIYFTYTKCKTHTWSEPGKYDRGHSPWKFVIKIKREIRLTLKTPVEEMIFEPMSDTTLKASHMSNVTLLFFNTYDAAIRSTQELRTLSRM